MKHTKLLLAILIMVVASPAFAEWEMLRIVNDGKIKILAEIRDRQVVIKYRNLNARGVDLKSLVNVHVDCRPSGKDRTMTFPPYGGMYGTHVNANSENNVFLDTLGCKATSVELEDVDVN